MHLSILYNCCNTEQAHILLLLISILITWHFIFLKYSVNIFESLVHTQGACDLFLLYNFLVLQIPYFFISLLFKGLFFRFLFAGFSFKRYNKRKYVKVYKAVKYCFEVKLYRKSLIYDGPLTIGQNYDGTRMGTLWPIKHFWPL